MKLYDSREILSSFHKDEWQSNAYQHFYAKLTNKQFKFPCIPATQGLALGQFKYGFIRDLRNKASYSEIAAMLRCYSQSYKSIGNYTSLVLFFEKPNSTEQVTIKNYEALFWRMLSNVNELDQSSWPKEIPKDPKHPFWEFCFEKERYFVFAATPAHVHRQSRSFPYFMLAITPRAVFESFQQKKAANTIKQRIRERLKDYDAIDPHPELNTYGDRKNFEAKQYFLRDDQTSLSNCPFHRFFSNKD